MCILKTTVSSQIIEVKGRDNCIFENVWNNSIVKEERFMAAMRGSSEESRGRLMTCMSSEISEASGVLKLEICGQSERGLGRLRAKVKFLVDMLNFEFNNLPTN